MWLLSYIRSPRPFFGVRDVVVNAGGPTSMNGTALGVSVGNRSSVYVYRPMHLTDCDNVAEQLDTSLRNPRIWVQVVVV